MIGPVDLGGLILGVRMERNERACKRRRVEPPDVDRLAQLPYELWTLAASFLAPSIRGVLRSACRFFRDLLPHPGRDRMRSAHLFFSRVGDRALVEWVLSQNPRIGERDLLDMEVAAARGGSRSMLLWLRAMRNEAGETDEHRAKTIAAAAA